jgi:hypothetical protein
MLQKKRHFIDSSARRPYCSESLNPRRLRKKTPRTLILRIKSPQRALLAFGQRRCLVQYLLKMQRLRLMKSLLQLKWGDFGSFLDDLQQAPLQKSLQLGCDKVH